MKLQAWFKRFGLLSLLAAHAGGGSAQSVLDGFDTVANGAVEAFFMQTDGKILVGGAFTQVNYSNHPALVRLTVDGRIDPGFAASADSDVLAIVQQANGQILVGGNFTHVDNTARNYLARVNADGSLDTAFNPNANGYVACLAVQADGKILAGGTFSHIANQSRSRIVRLNSDGSIDPGFTASASGLVAAMAIQPDGKIVIAGDFTFVDSLSRLTLARLYPDGRLDSAFAAAPNSNVFALALQADGKIVAGGQFTQMNSQPRHYLARLNANGTLDDSFRDLNTDGIVDAMARQPDGTLVIGGDFTAVDGTTRNHVARIRHDVSVDPDFDPDASLTGSPASVAALALQGDGKLLVGGAFDHAGGQPHDNIARFYPGGSLDAELAYGVTDLPKSDAFVSALALRADDRIVVAGNFNQLGAQTQHMLGQLRADGLPDASFADPQIPYYGSFTLTSVALPPNATAQSPLIIGGFFEQVDGYAIYSLAELDASATPLLGFQPAVRNVFGTDSLIGTINAVAILPDGNVVIGGYFDEVNGYSRVNLAVIKPDGKLDYDFDIGNALDTNVFALALQPDGKIIASGEFYDGSEEFALLRFNVDGSLDAGFSAVLPAPYATALTPQPDGRLLVASETPDVTTRSHYLSRLNADGSVDANFHAPVLPVGTSANAFAGAVASIALQADGKILLGGSFTTINGGGRHGLVRLNPDGTVDAGYADIAFDADVRALLLQPDGKLVAGGSFTSPGYGIARVATIQPAPQSLTVNSDGSIVAWLRTGPAPELQAPPTLSWSVDGVNEQVIGTMTRFFGAWIFTGWTAPQATLIYLHVHGISADGSGRSGGTAVDSVVEFYRSDAIFANGFE